MIMDATSLLCKHYSLNRFVLMLLPPHKWWREQVNSCGIHKSLVFMFEIYAGYWNS